MSEKMDCDTQARQKLKKRFPASWIEVHARREKGKIIFRLWNREAQRYVTGKIPEDVLCISIMTTACLIESTTISPETIEDRIAYAAEHGDESVVPENGLLDKPWLEEKK